MILKNIDNDDVNDGLTVVKQHTPKNQFDWI
jgi:hypothetical protein